MHPTMLAYWSTEALTLIHGNPVVDGWAGAVMHKRLTSLAPTVGPMDRPTRQGIESRVRD